MKYAIALGAILTLAGGAVAAQINTDGLIAEYRAQGFTQIEVRTGLTQTRVEAIRGTEKLEVVMDSATGAVLRSETNAVGALDNTASGVSVRDRARDFLRVSSSGQKSATEDSTDHEAGDDDGADDDVGDDHGVGDHDSGDHEGADHEGRGHGNGGHDRSGSDGGED